MSLLIWWTRPTLRTCSSDTILRAIKELTQENISHTSDMGKNYDFNTADTLNTLLLNCMFASGQLKRARCMMLISTISSWELRSMMQSLDIKRFGLNATSRIKAFVFRFVSVPAKWIRTSRWYVLNIYTCNNVYADVFQTDFGWRLQLMGMILRIVSSRIMG